MGSQLTDIEFTVMDKIRVDPGWAAKYPEYAEFKDGILMILTPPYAATDEELGGVTPIALAPGGVEIQFEFTNWKVNAAGHIGLFFDFAKEIVVPVGAKVRFVGSGSLCDPDYVEQDKLEVFEADRILSRLEKEGIRFQIEPVTTERFGDEVIRLDSKIRLFIHVDDLEAWEEVGGERKL